MSKTKRTFDANYKLHICELIRRQGLTITQVCTDNSLGQSTVHRWLNQYDAERQGKAGIELDWPSHRTWNKRMAVHGVRYTP